MVHYGHAQHDLGLFLTDHMEVKELLDGHRVQAISLEGVGHRFIFENVLAQAHAHIADGHAVAHYELVY
jgi:hypothetical protein